MDIRACYDAMGADYEEIFGRFHSEKLIIKFVGNFWMTRAMQACAAHWPQRTIRRHSGRLIP